MIRVLHLASFNGNIGDIANHIGFWNLFKKYVTADVRITYLEIREFYQSWRLRKFDDDFVDIVNHHDLLVIGGGNFFDVKWDYSRTGITIDLPPEILEKIKTPVIFNGIGVDFNPEKCPDFAKKNFDSFIKYLNLRPDKFIVSVRNDDSRFIMEKYMDYFTISNIMQIPDGGFFTSAHEYGHSEIPKSKTVIAINIAKDRIADRWGDEDHYKKYCTEFSAFINESISKNDNFHFVFVPHIPLDLQAISDVLVGVRDYNCRRNITIAPYLNGINTPGDYAVDLYRKADLVVGMRYHSNICAIAMNTPTVGIVTLPKHIELYKNIGMEDRLFNVSNIPFSELLYKKILLSIENRKILEKQNMELVRRLEENTIDYFVKIKKLIG